MDDIPFLEKRSPAVKGVERLGTETHVSTSVNLASGHDAGTDRSPERERLCINKLIKSKPCFDNDKKLD